MAPMTRLRARNDHVPTEIMVQYYSQRASMPGTLIVTEATFVSAASRGRDQNAPGIYTPEQIEGWNRVCTAVHDRGCHIFMQLWHVGRAARPHALAAAGIEMVSSSAIPITSQHKTPRPMAEDEIKECIDSFAQAALNAIRAGCDGVEIHAANGYLIDQFTQDTCNQRRDSWGGAYRVDHASVWKSFERDFQGMGMENPIPQFTYLIEQLRVFGLAYLHLIEPRVSGNAERSTSESENLEFALKAWDRSGPVILAGGYSPQMANHALQTKLKDEQAAVAFGRFFISNPDLPNRIIRNIDIAAYDPNTFYTVLSSEGYIDYPYGQE